MTQGEKRLYEWQYGSAGHFVTHLFDAIMCADTKNQKLFMKAFPEETEAYIRYGQERGYWDRVKKAYRNREFTSYATRIQEVK